MLTPQWHAPEGSEVWVGLASGSHTTGGDTAVSLQDQLPRREGIFTWES